MASFQEWPVVAWNAVDSVDWDRNPIANNNPGYMVFFVLFIMMSQYLFFNLFIGVIFTAFSEVKASKMGTDGMSRRQESWCHVCQMIAQPSSGPIQIPPLPMDGWRLWSRHNKVTGNVERVTCNLRRLLYRVVLSKEVDYFISTVILANVVVLALKTADEQQVDADMHELLNKLFTLIFIIECVAKIMAINFSTYWSQSWNRMDFVLVTISVVDLIVLEFTDADQDIRAFGALRVLRVFRLVRKSRQVKLLFEMIMQSWSYLANAILVYLLLLIMFSILAMNLFGDLPRGRFRKASAAELYYGHTVSFIWFTDLTSLCCCCS